MEFLPAKVAHEEERTQMTTTFMPRPSIHDLMKEAMEGFVTKSTINDEALRQMENVGVKTASAEEDPGVDRVPAEFIGKITNGLEFLAKEAEAGRLDLNKAATAMTASGVGPGQGPNTLTVTPTAGRGEPPGPGGQGEATQKPPMNPPSASSGVAKDPPTGLQTNASMMYREQPADPMNGKTASAAPSLFDRNRAALGLPKVASLEEKNREALKKLSMCGDAIAAKMETPKSEPKSTEKKAADANVVTSLFEAHRAKVASLKKMAEDAINPAHISAGAAPAQGATPPPGAAPAGVGVPSEPADVTRQKSMISSNEAAINYTKRQAKADPKSDLGRVLKEPALSAATDKTLNLAFAHTQQAGAKIASDLTRTAAAQALLQKLAEEADASKKKEKTSNMPGSYNLSTPAGQSGFNASAQGGS